MIDAVNAVNQNMDMKGDRRHSARMHQYELAYRMQRLQCRGDEHQQRARVHPPLYGTGAGQIFICEQLPAGAKTRGARRSFCSRLYDWGWDSHGTDERRLTMGFLFQMQEIDRATTAPDPRPETATWFCWMRRWWCGAENLPHTDAGKSREQDQSVLGRDHHT